MSQTLIEDCWRVALNYCGEKNITTIGSFIFHEVVYFGLSLLYYLISLVPAMEKYKVQPNKQVSCDMVLKCFKHLALTHVLLQLPIVMVFYYFSQIVGIRVTPDLPSVSAIVLGVTVSLFVEDFYFYWFHRLLHWGVWYKAIHKVHHEYPSPFGMVAEYAHPVEVILLGFGTILGPLLSINHIFTLYVYLFMRLFQTVEAHCGYEYPWSPSKFIPFWGGAQYHDYHHETSSGNYGSFFTIWDHLFNTDEKYYQRIKKRKIGKTF